MREQDNPVFLGYSTESNMWSFSHRIVAEFCEHWWDIRGWTWEDCVEFLHEPDDAHRWACLVLSPKVR
jgi:hypothetical protein